jgi:hypothetical protein
MEQREFEIGKLVCVFLGIDPDFEVNKPKPGVVFRALQGKLSDGVFYVGDGLDDHLLCWYSIEGEHTPPIKAIEKSIYWNSFLTGTISNYVLIVDAEAILKDVD